MQTEQNRDKVKIEPSWKKALAGEFDKSYLSELRTFLAKEISAKKIIYPKSSEIFRAFDLTPYDRVRVVVLGQDPYHGPDQAHGLCFSVRRGVAPPPSLKNIYKELQADLGIAPSSHGDLSSWAEQGVLLLNTVLTVEDGKAASHRGKGWEAFTDRVISELSARERPIIFVLWGSFAQSKAPMVRRPPHAVLMAPHPSPLSAHRGFLGSKPFSAINRQLKAWGEPPIDWKLPE